MKVAVIADTHGKYDHLIEPLKELDLSYIIHLGDFVEDGKILSELTNIPLIIVKGNNDYLAYTEPEELYTTIEGKSFFISHGHRLGVYRGLNMLLINAKEHGSDVVLFGHTHMYHEEMIDNILVLNPGSASYARGGDKESIAILDLDTLEVQKIEF
ncbi:MAG: metallophosphoesterase [Gallicola sp.]|nr:metallophosphoesterase [Gallicola sp.]